MTHKRTARLLPRLNEISALRWNALTQGEVFLSHEFLSALEVSGSVGAQTGWQPCHLLLEEGETLLAAMPLYLKGHSQGEYIFDQGWAEASMRAGLPYYPKLVSCVPFTPVGGHRLLGDKKHHPALLSAALQSMTQVQAHSLHLNFLPQAQWEQAGAEEQMMQRTHYQFHWHNQDYTCFDDFLSQLTSRHRKNIKKERKRAQENLVIKQFTGKDLTESLWDEFFVFYMDTGERKWGKPYLTREAFSLLGKNLGDRILLLMAFDGERPIAGALNFIDEDRLYGRYWGCSAYHPCLHFELSYYQAIDFAIANKIKVVEAGAQGEHKIERGYIPIKSFSAHKIVHTELSNAVGDYLVRERDAIDAEIDYLNGTTPFRKNALQ